MNISSTQIKTHAKWVLAGEHAVMRGINAIALPLTEYELVLNYQPSMQPLTICFEGEYGETLRVLVWGAIHEAMNKAHIDINQLTGKLHITNSIPMGAGLGFSAALCVAIGRLLIHFELLNEIELYHFAKHLEDMFHGKSSGMDIASVIYNTPIIFNKEAEIIPIQLAWQPKFYLSYTQQHSLTIDSIKHVELLLKNKPDLSKEIDEQMSIAVKEMQEALQTNETIGKAQLIAAMQKARNCFQQWGLISDQMHEHAQTLEKLGAVVTKPTGAGNGGFMISLWDTTPKNLNEINLIRAY